MRIVLRSFGNRCVVHSISQDALRCSPASCRNTGQPRLRQHRAAAEPGDLYSDIAGDVSEDAYSGPQLARLDVNDSGGLGGTSEEVFGELAALLVGFTQAEFEKFREIMIDMEADIVKMIPCSRAMLSLTLEQAVKSPVPTFEQLPSDTRRAVILSGMSTEEVMEVISYYHDTEELPQTLWGAAVPKNYERNLRGLIAEMYDDHDWMRQQAEGLHA